MTRDWLTPDALVVAVDYATYVRGEVAREAALFLVDERGAVPGQPRRRAASTATRTRRRRSARRSSPAPSRRPAAGSSSPISASAWRTSSSATAIVRRATELGLGTVLPR